MIGDVFAGGFRSRPMADIRICEQLNCRAARDLSRQRDGSVIQLTKINNRCNRAAQLEKRRRDGMDRRARQKDSWLSS